MKNDEKYKKALEDIHRLFEGEVIDDSEEIPEKVLDIVLEALKES
jgi:antitoxin component HigA of HigAB toxin-antitoxin module